jgi:hypothetical protein
VRDFAEARKIALSRSYGYANGNEDIAFLTTVGYATAVNPKPALLEAARREGWKVLRFASRRNASPVTLARSLGGLWRCGGHVARRPRLRRDDRQETPRRRIGQRDKQRCHAGDDGHRRQGPGRAPPVGAPAIGVPVQSSKFGRRLRNLEPAEARHYRCREEGVGQGPAHRPHPARAGLRIHRPQQHLQRHRIDAAGGRPAPNSD